MKSSRKQSSTGVHWLSTAYVKSLCVAVRSIDQLWYVSITNSTPLCPAPLAWFCLATALRVHLHRPRPHRSSPHFCTDPLCKSQPLDNTQLFNHLAALPSRFFFFYATWVCFGVKWRVLFGQAFNYSAVVVLPLVYSKCNFLWGPWLFEIKNFLKMHMLKLLRMLKCGKVVQLRGLNFFFCFRQYFVNIWNIFLINPRKNWFDLLCEICFFQPNAMCQSKTNVRCFAILHYSNDH